MEARKVQRDVLQAAVGPRLVGEGWVGGADGVRGRPLD